MEQRLQPNLCQRRCAHSPVFPAALHLRPHTRLVAGRPQHVTLVCAQYVLVQLTINGEGPYDFMLDSGGVLHRQQHASASGRECQQPGSTDNGVAMCTMLAQKRHDDAPHGAARGAPALIVTDRHGALVHTCSCLFMPCAGLTAEVITPTLRDQLGQLPVRGKVQGLGAGGATGGDLVRAAHCDSGRATEGALGSPVELKR